MVCSIELFPSEAILALIFIKLEIVAVSPFKATDNHFTCNTAIITSWSKTHAVYILASTANYPFVSKAIFSHTSSLNVCHCKFINSLCPLVKYMQNSCSKEVRIFSSKLCTSRQTDACIMPSWEAGLMLRCLRTEMNYFVDGKGAMIILFPLKKLFFIG